MCLKPFLLSSVMLVIIMLVIVVILLVLEVPEVVVIIIICWTDGGDGEQETCHIATCDTMMKKKNLTKMIKKRLKMGKKI